jgi:hypothetical protein
MDDLPGIGLRAGDRALVIVSMQDGRTVEGMGKVRRLFEPKDDRPASIAVELVGLNAAEVAELARETNNAAQEQARANPLLATAGKE